MFLNFYKSISKGKKNNLKRKLNTTPFSKSVSTKLGELVGCALVQGARVQENHKWAGFPELWIKFLFEEEVISVPPPENGQVSSAYFWFQSLKCTEWGG